MLSMCNAINNSDTGIAYNYYEKEVFAQQIMKRRNTWNNSSVKKTNHLRRELTCSSPRYQERNKVKILSYVS